MKMMAGNGLLTSEHEKWKHDRKLLNPAFNHNVLRSNLRVINRNLDTLMDVIERKRIENQSIIQDIRSVIEFYVLETVCENLFDVKMQTLDIDVPAVISDTKIALENAFHFSLKPWLWMSSIARMTDTGKQFERTIVSLNRVVDQQLIPIIKNCSERELNRANGCHSTDGQSTREPLILSEILIGHNLPDSELRAQVMTFLFAGFHTTSIAITWTLSLIGEYPTVQRAIHDEIDALFPDHNLIITMEKLNQMKFTECAIKESLRLYPVFPVMMRINTEEFRCGKHVIPANSEIAISPYHTHRLEQYFPAADQFIPERWLFSDHNPLHSPPPQYAYLPFSAGPRNCIGQKYALITLKSIVATILRKYRITSLDKTENLERQLDASLEPKSDVNIKFELRSEI